MLRAAASIHTRAARRLDPVRPALELGALLLTGALHLAWPVTGLSRAVLVFPLVAGWLGYFLLRYRVDPGLVRELGFRREGLETTMLACLGIVAATAPPMIAWGLTQGASLHWSTPLTLLVYPVWGLVQQALVQVLLTRNLARLAPTWIASLGSATAFGLVHWNEPLLVPATFVLGLIFAPLYLRTRNLWPLGIAHGWLGTCIYTFVLMRDPLAAYLVG